MSSADPLVRIADELYAEPPDRFTAARDAAARRVEDRALAGAVRRLRKPVVAAWVVNLLVRRESEQIDHALELGASLRDAAAAMDAEQLRALTRQRRQLTAALTTTARRLAGSAGVRISGAVADQVEGTLNAAMLDPTAADAVRTGLVIAPMAATGLDRVDVAAVLAVPAALGGRASPLPAQDGPRLRVVAESEQLRRERVMEALRSAEAEGAAAEREVAEAEATVQEWNARALQVNEEVDELRRRVDELEEEADRVESELEEAEGTLAEARESLSRARARQRQAEREVVDTDKRSGHTGGETG